MGTLLGQDVVKAIGWIVGRAAAALGTVAVLQGPDGALRPFVSAVRAAMGGGA